MWLLSQEQTSRLVALQRQRDLRHLGAALASAFPEAQTRLAQRWDEFVVHGATRAAAFGLRHLLCVARYLASCIVCGADLETRQPWAGAILNDSQRGQGAKAYQLCVRALEQLGSAPHPGPAAAAVNAANAAAFSLALKQLDQQLAAAGTLASLLPRDRISLGAACDVDALELRLLEPQWRQHYTAQAGPWRREACAPKEVCATLVHDPLADAPARLPEQITLLSQPAHAGAAAQLRVRVKTEHRCDPQLHPLLQCLGPADTRVLRGDLAGETTFSVHAPPPAADAPALTHMGEEDSPQYMALTVACCGLRSRGVPLGELATRLAAYDAKQHLIAWRREPTPAWQLPADAPPPVVPARCRREADGQLVDSSSWAQGFADLDLALQQGLARLLTAWERESGVSDGKLAIEAAVLVGQAGITWGWAETAQGIAGPPYMRVEGLSDLVACRLALCFTGTLARAGSRALLSLTTDGSTALTGPWQRGPEDAALFVVAATQQVQVRQHFELRVQPLADAGLAVLARCAPLQGAISGAVGLEQRPDGPGLRWFVRLAVEPVVAQLRIMDPLLGVHTLAQRLLPAQVLVDWSQA
jgi:hypothetical protein